MHLQTKTTLLLVIGLILSACQPQQSSKTAQQLAAGISSGDLQVQLTALTKLVKTGKPLLIPRYQEQIEQIMQVKSFNQQAEQLLAQQPFEAMEVAVKADKLVYNEGSRKIIKKVLAPYIDFLPLHLELRAWAYIPFEKMVVPDSLPPGLQQWREASDKPNLWPDNELMEILQLKNKKPLKYLAATAEERRKYSALLRLVNRLARKSPEDLMIQSLDEDAATINMMYNAIITDLNWFYLQKGLIDTIAANNELIEVGYDAVKDELSDKEWVIDFNLSKGIHTDKIGYCCTFYIKKIAELYPFLDRPSNFQQAVQILGKDFNAMVDNNFAAQESAADTITFAKKQNLKLTQRLENIQALNQGLDRNELASSYLRVTYAWQNNSFHDLERLIPYLKQYKSILRGL
jgi:hypothetical protein